MAVFEVSVAAATAVLNYDLLRDETWTTAPWPRVIRALAICGSAAAGDCAASLKVGQTEVAKKYNTTTGFPTRDHLVGVGARVPAGMKISLIVIDAPSTNPMNALVDIVP